MSKQANSAQTSKLQAEVTKLKQQLALTQSQLKTASKSLKDQKNNFKTELAAKIATAVKDARTQANTTVEKKISLRDKAVAEAISKFEKDWAKKAGTSTKAKAKTKTTKTPAKKAKTAKKTTAVAV